MADDYLWDRSGTPDPDIEKLENVLGRLRAEGSAPPRVLVMREQPWRARRALSWAAAVALIVIGAAAIRILLPSPSWTVARLSGAPRVNRQTVTGEERLHVGQWLETSAADRARLTVPAVGELEIEPASRIRLVRARRGDQRFSLAYGTVHAVIWAPPGQFHVETPSGLATDLGCTYTLQVDLAGFGSLHVTSGWVAFADGGSESFVPAGAECRTHPQSGPGTPFYEDASPTFRDALERFDRTGDQASLTRVVEEARVRDALTLWHLISRTRGAVRESVVAALAERVPPPSAEVREGARRADRASLDRWWNELGLGDAGWWRMWERPAK
jgi:hypothetical protein